MSKLEWNLRDVFEHYKKHKPASFNIIAQKALIFRDWLDDDRPEFSESEEDKFADLIKLVKHFDSLRDYLLDEVVLSIKTINCWANGSVRPSIYIGPTLVREAKRVITEEICAIHKIQFGQKPYIQ